MLFDAKILYLFITVIGDIQESIVTKIFKKAIIRANKIFLEFRILNQKEMWN